MSKGKYKKSDLILLDQPEKNYHITFTFSHLREFLSLMESDLTFYLSVKGDKNKILKRFEGKDMRGYYKKLRYQYFFEINSNGLLPDAMNYKWAANNLGKSRGLILFFNNEPSPSVFVKSIGLSEFADVACLKVASQIGIKVPAVEWKVGDKFVYQFSYNLTRTTVKGKYQYKDIGKYNADENYYIDMVKRKVFANRKPDGTFSQSFEIDKKSISRLLIAILLFGLSDTHDGNIGIIKSEKGGKEKYKLGLIDFQLHPEKKNKMGPKQEEEALKEYMRKFLKIFLRDEDFPSILPFVDAIDDADIEVAFEKIRERFDTAYGNQGDLEKYYRDAFERDDSWCGKEDYPSVCIENIQKRWTHNFSMLSKSMPPLLLSGALKSSLETDEESEQMQIEPQRTKKIKVDNENKTLLEKASDASNSFRNSCMLS